MIEIGLEDKYWLLGLFEGEGYFVVSRVKTNGKVYPSFRIGIEMNESITYFEYIQNLIGGSIILRKNRPKSVQLVVRKKEDLLRFYDNFKNLPWRARKGLQFNQFFKRYFEYTSKGYGDRLTDDVQTISQNLWGKKGSF